MSSAGNLIKTARTKKKYDLRKDVGQALQLFVDYKKAFAQGTAKTVDDFENQQSLDLGAEFQGEKPSDTAKALFHLFADVKSIRQCYEVLNEYSTLAQKEDLETPDMFGAEPPSKMELLERAEQNVAEAKRELFPGEREYSFQRKSINGVELDKISGNLGKYFNNVKDAIRALYTKALTHRNEGNKSFVNFAEVTDNERAIMSKISGVDLSGAKVHGIDESAIRHADNRHGIGEKRNDQTPLTEDDFVKIPEIINDTVPEYQGKNSVGNHIFQYRKKIGNEYFYIEEYRNGQGKLSGVSLEKERRHP